MEYFDYSADAIAVGEFCQRADVKFPAEAAILKQQVVPYMIETRVVRARYDDHFSVRCAQRLLVAIPRAAGNSEYQDLKFTSVL